jgi:hypothetical protein
MEGVGMVYASNVAQRISEATTTAKRMASPHSRKKPFGFFGAVSVAEVFSQNFTAIKQYENGQQAAQAKQGYY